MLRKIFAGILLFFLATSQVSAENIQNEIDDHPETALVIVLDISESMRKADVEGQLRNELASWVESLGIYTHVSLVRYNLDIIEEDTAFYTKGNPGLSNLTARIKAEMKGAYSDTGAALVEAYKRLESLGDRAEYKSILLLSDDELDLKGKEGRTEADSKADIDRILSGGYGDMAFDLHFAHVTYGGDVNTGLIDTMRAHPKVVVSDLSKGEALDSKLGLLKLFLSDIAFELLTPKLVDGQWVEATSFPLDSSIELYAYFAQGNEVVTDPVFLNSFTFILEDGGQASEMKLAKAQDSFYALLAYDLAGEHMVKVTAEGRSTTRTFTRTMALEIGMGEDAASGAAVLSKDGEQIPVMSDGQTDETGTGLFGLTTNMSISILLTVVAVFAGLFAYRLSRELSSKKKGKPVDRTLQLTIINKNGAVCNPFKVKVLKGETVRLSSLIGSKAGTIKLGDIYKISIRNQFNILQIQNDESLYSCLNEEGTVIEDKVILLKEGERLHFHHTKDLNTRICLECIGE